MLFAGIMCSCGGESEKTSTETASSSEKTSAPVINNATQASLSSVLDAYFELKNALVEADTLAASNASLKLAALTDSISTEGITDSSLINTIQNLSGTISSEAIALPQEANITDKRRSFAMIGENLYPLLQAVKYQGGTLYQQMCPMAFNETEAAYWISNSREVINPYLGKKHPKYAAGMLHCGEVKDSINFH